MLVVTKATAVQVIHVYAILKIRVVQIYAASQDFLSGLRTTGHGVKFEATLCCQDNFMRPLQVCKMDAVMIVGVHISQPLPFTIPVAEFQSAVWT